MVRFAVNRDAPPAPQPKSPLGSSSFGQFVRALRHRHGDWLLLLACWPALVLLFQLLRILGSRIAFPMDLEWIEGGQMLHVHRVLHGMDLFVEPNQGFMPYSYPPGHTLILTAVAWVFGLDYTVARAVSWLATAGAMGLLAREVYREFAPLGFPQVWSILALGSMAAAFPLTGGWFDLVRNDEVALVLALASALSTNALGTMSRTRFFGTAALMTMAMFTKQTAVFYIAFALLFQLFRCPRRAVLLGVTVAAFSLLTLGLLQAITSGRYFYYTFSLLAQQQVHEQRYAEALSAWLTFAPYLPIIPVLIIASWWFGLLSARACFMSGMLLAAFPASLLPYAKQGGYLNNLLPVAFCAGPAALCLVASLLKAVPQGSRAAKALALTLAASAALYLDARTFPISNYVVPESRWRSAEKLYATLRGLGGSLLMPHQPYVAIRAGSRIEQLHEMAWADAWLAGVPNLDFRPFLERTRAQYVTVTGLEIPAFFEGVADDYTLYRALPPDQLVPPITGYPSHPRFILVRSQPTPGQTCLFQFESAYVGWTASGDAFDGGAASRGDQGRPIIGRQGRLAASSFHPARGDAATGTLTSTEFTLTSPRLSLRVGGGSSNDVGVELLVGDVAVATARGQGVDYLERVTWDVAPFAGKTARLRVFDRDTQGFGHILVDEVCLER